MDQPKSKPYFIQVYGQKDNSLLNKYKFVLSAQKVTDLKGKILEKLIAKDHADKDTKVAIKDIDDFQLGSDDEVEDVVPDGKVRIYIKSPQQDQKNINPPNPQNQKKIDKQNLPQKPISQTTIPSSTTIQNKPTGVSANTPIIDTSSLTIPEISSNCPKASIMSIICPQIRKTPFSVEAREGLSFLEFSSYIVKQLNLDPRFKAIIYDHQGQALLFSLDMLNLKMPKLNLTKEYYIIFTTTPSTTDQAPVQPMFTSKNPVNLTVNKGTKSYNFNIDLENTLSVLKMNIFHQTKIHPSNQILKFANNPLLSDLQALKSYGIKDGSILELSFKVISNILPASFADKFYYKDVQLINEQDTESIRQFRSNLLAFSYHLSESDKNRFKNFIEFYTTNKPLSFALTLLFKKAFLSQAHRIALEEGFYVAMWHFISACNPVPQTEVGKLFSHTRDFFGFVMEGMKNTPKSEVEINARSQTLVIQNSCALTTKPIKIPVFVKLDNENFVLVDKAEVIEQINKGYTFPEWQKPTKELLLFSEELDFYFDIFKLNQVDYTEITTVLPMGSHLKPIEFAIPSGQNEASHYANKITTTYSDLKVHQPLEIKSKSTIYLMFKNKEQQYRIYVSKNKDINRPYNVFDVVKGTEEAVNLDLMMAAGKTENLQEAVDKKDLKPVITREPKEAIVVLFDHSGSMGSKFFNEVDLKRIGAVKLFFEALAYRTIAYNFQHVVSLIFFDYQIEVQCDFTEAIYDFNRLVSQAVPRGSTRLYDSIITGAEQLVDFKKRYPNCVLRIMAMTDGEDTGSSRTIFDAASAVIKNGIIMDSFAVGTNCEGLKNITIATGGKCYLTRNVNESLKLFEQETVLSARARKVEPLFTGTTDAQIRDCLEKAKYKPFDLSDSVHEFKMPEIKSPSMNVQDLTKHFESEEGKKKIANSSSLKRIMKEIETYNKNPHPFVAIYPCANINIWKILLLGPKETPYENGLFVLYANFPGEYPFKAPEVRFITPIYHCNMNQQGRICHSVFDRNYSPALTFRQIVDCVYGLILTPEPDDPLDNVIASYYLSEYPKYLANAVEATKKNASKSTVEIVEEIFGKIGDDIERQKRVEEINKWIETAKSFN